MTELIIKVPTTTEELINQWEAKQELKLLFVAFPKLEVYNNVGLIANDLVSVQPMSAPTGTLRYIEYVYYGEMPTQTTHDCGIEKTLKGE